ncbi:MAG: transporter substrate-binding domain-containing protein [Alphaproteobacteria bacterium]|nr:transporter substrate-binding domain-containing protein [Alphaproteobacteria bacterium]
MSFKDMIKIFVMGLVAVVMTGSVQAQNLSGGQNTHIKYIEEEVVPQQKFQRKKVYECGHIKPIRVAGFVTNPPFGWVDVVPNELKGGYDYFNNGLSYNLFSKIAREQKLKIQDVGFRSYFEAQQALKRGEIDVLLGAYYDKRVLGAGTSILFPGYFSNPIVVAFLKGNEREVNSLSDLIGLKGVVRQEEGIYSLMHQKIPADLDVKQVSGARKAYMMLLSGEADFIITSLYAAEAESRRFKIHDKIYLTNVPIETPELFFVFGATSECLPLKEIFAEQVEKERDNVRSLLFGQIDVWVERFRYSDSLIMEMQSNGMVISPLLKVDSETGGSEAVKTVPSASLETTGQ